jgi:hypothetical protein
MNLSFQNKVALVTGAGSGMGLVTARAFAEAGAAVALADVHENALRSAAEELVAAGHDSKTTRDFVSLLPLTLTMNDLFRREKFAHLPRAISEEGKRSHTYEVGQVVYWSPGPDVAIFYRNDGEKIPNPGIIVIGKIDSGVAALDVAGSVKVTIELHDEQ